MRKLTRKQLLARLFAGFFAIGSMLCTVNSAVAGGPTYGKYYHNKDLSKSCFDSEIRGPDSNNIINLTITGPDSPAPDIYSGYTDSNGNVENNKLTITTNEGVATKLSNVYGGYTNIGNATQNIIDIAGSTINGDVYGGKVGTDTTGIGNAVSNTIIIKDSDVSDSTIYGGYTYNGDANSNTVEITNSKAGTVWGGYIMSESATGSTNSNTLKLTDSEVYGSNIVAAYNKGTGDAKENTIEINGGTIEGSLIAGADVVTGSAISNKVTLLGCSSVTCGQILGGFVTGENGKAYSNAVTLDNIEKLNVYWVAGGYVKSDEAASNTVTINNSIINGRRLNNYAVLGGGVSTGDAIQNEVTISGGTINGYVYGGLADTGDTDKNIVRINDGSKVNAVVSGVNLSDVKVIGGYVANNGNATNNRVELNGASSVNGAYNPDSSGTLVSDANVYGGYVGGNGNVANNTVIISGASSIKGASGVDGSGNNMVSSGKAYGGYIKNGNATENAVEISDNSTVDGDVYGAYVIEQGNAESNKVSVVGSTVNGDVYGGFSLAGEIKNNIIEISNKSQIVGSVVGCAGDGSQAADNKLIISGTGNTVGAVANIDAITFKLASEDDDQPMLTIGDSMDLEGVSLYSELPENGFNGKITLIDGFIDGYDSAKYYIDGEELVENKSDYIVKNNNSYICAGSYKYNTSEKGISLESESLIAAKYTNDKNTTAAKDNTLILTKDLAGNYSTVYGAFNADGGAATGATVELSEAVSNENLTIYGGYSTGSGVDVTTDNTLEVAKSGSKIKNILNFEKINFFTDSASDQTMLTLAADTVDLSNTSINVTFKALDEGETLTLLDTKKLVLNNDNLSINGEALDSNLSLKFATYGGNNEYVNVGGYSMANDGSKLTVTADESILTSKYTNGNESLAVEKFELTNDFSNFKTIYGSYSADNSAAEGGKLFINEAVNLSETTLIGGKSAGNGEVKNNTLEISSAAAGSKINGAENFDNYKFVLGSDLSNGATVLSSNEQVNLANATVDAELSGMALNKGEKVVLLDNADKSDAVLKLNGNTGDRSSVAENNGTFLVVNRYGYNTDDSKIAIECKDTFAAGAFLDEKGNIVGNKTLTLGGSTASNMRAGYERASSAPDISECENIYGIYSEGDSIPSGGVVEIVSPIQFNNCKIHGGYSTKRGYWSSGNTLKVDTLNARVRAITHFEKMEFNLPSETRNGSIMLTVADSLDLEPTKKITVNASKATNNLKVGDKVRLINCEGGIKHFSKQEKIIKGLTDKISDIALERSSLNLLIKGEQQNNNTKAPVEAISATTALVNHTSELAAGKLNRNMVMAVDVSRIDAAKDNSENNSNIKTVPVKTDFATFAALSGGNLTYNTGSYVKSDSWNVGFGIGKKGMSSKNPDATYGLFFQYGKSNFSTHNDGGYRGDGDSKMFGAGLMFHQEANSKYYYQGSISAGKVDADWSCKDGSYDDKATYYGMTFGMGRKHNVGGNKTMDVYGRYSFNHVGSMEGDLNGNKYDFDSTNSHNLRFGFRMEYAKKNAATAYWGLAWEHEFAGASGATLTTPNIVERTASPSLKGDSGIAEVGYQWKRGNWEYNINAEGSFGKREGVTGSFNINYNF